MDEDSGYWRYQITPDPIRFVRSARANIELTIASGGGTRQSANYIIQDILDQWVSESPASTIAHLVAGF